ncbi:hypothetical protein DL98DRAFT_420538, partial [Cadophora sp. DSE1049]
EKKRIYQLITTVIKINKITVCNTNLPSNINQFFTEFTRLIIASLIDLFSGYDQFILAL